MNFTREKLEELEGQFLSPYGLRSKDSKGRAFPESEPKYRTAFQRDRERILHTTAFRRLEYKTQVFVNFESDYYRTRLTHTLEVAQIGRSIARTLGANEDLIEAICLAHDLGHSPFGHSGEVILNQIMAEHGGFDHNKQSLRIVIEIEQRFSEFPGLNLTWETREGIVKHETEYDISDASSFNPDLRGHLEAQIANIADELAYSTHDLDDGLRSGMITPNMLKNNTLWNMMIDSIGWDGSILDDVLRHRLIRRLIGIEVNDILSATGKRLSENNVQSVEQVQNMNYNMIGFSDEMQVHHGELKKFLFRNLYRHPRIVRMQVKAEQIISAIFQAFLQEPSMLPYHYQAQIDQLGLERTICDYIAGMTDRYAVEEHSKLFNPTIRT